MNTMNTEWYLKIILKPINFLWKLYCIPFNRKNKKIIIEIERSVVKCGDLYKVLDDKIFTKLGFENKVVLCRDIYSGNFYQGIEKEDLDSIKKLYENK